MSADVPRPSLNRHLPPSTVTRTNRRQVLVFAVLTLLLTAATVWGGRLWVRASETLIFAVGDADSDEAHFAARLSDVLENTSSRLRLKILTGADRAKALAQFDRKQADLAILRTDGKIPSLARAIAILEHDILLLLGPGSRKIKSLAELKKKKIAILGEGDTNLALVRKILDVSNNPDGGSRIQMAQPGSTLDKLFGADGFGAVIAIPHASSLINNKSYERYARHGGFTLNAIDEAKALARKFPGITEETLSTGALSASPAIPDDDLETVGVEWLLVARAKMTTTAAGELAGTIYENKAALALEDGFASTIEPASTDKDAFIIAHDGAAEYINDDTKSFVDRYSDMLYLAAAALSVIGSIFATIYAQVTRVAPEKASELATAILLVGERIEHANSLDALEALQDELEAILRGAVMGLRDGTISTDGLETFKLCYEFVRDEIGMRRDHLKRHSGPCEGTAGGDAPEHVAVEQTAHGA
jgi:TRAP-type uncharacterized transport system substrate-binding protein